MSINVTQILDAVSSALTVIKNLANTPGINMIPYATTISSAISALQTAYAVGKDVTPFVVAIKDTFSGDAPPTPEQLAALDAKIAELQALVNAPLPPQEEGEPD